MTMAGQSEKNLKVRIEQVNDVINDAYQSMMDSQDSDDPEADAEYDMYAKRYEQFTKLLVLLTKNYDEAVSMDRAERAEGSKRKPKTALQKMRGE
jgi:hypothetical protein